MRHVLLSPRWVLGHVLVLALFVACLWLGWWQWTRAESPTGTAQNFGYALQWPVFAGFGLFFWIRVVRDGVRPRRPPTRSARAAARMPAVEPAGPPPIDAEADPELAAYNSYLAALHAADQPRAGRPAVAAPDGG